jgi:hypothetical protein
MTKLEEIEAKRAARKASLDTAAEDAKASDLEAIDELEQEHGDSNVKVIHVPYTAGLPTCVAVRTPKPAEAKRYRARVKTQPGSKHAPDYVVAAEELAETCLVYPTKELYERLVEARPGLATQVGLKALELSTGVEEAEGKG